MKKLIILAIAIILGAFNANAQFGSVLKKVAKQTESSIREKATEKAAEQAEQSIEEQLGTPEESSDEPAVDESDEPLTYESLMKMLPTLPSASDLVNYKKAELNGQSFKLMTSPVLKFQMSILDLTGKVYSIPYQGADSAQIMDAAYKSAELYTGLTKEEIDMLATMSEEEQEAYLSEHYNEGHAEAVLLEQAAELGEEMEPLQPDIDRWSSFDDKITENHNECDAKCKKIYEKYADKLANAEGDDDARNKVLFKYYEEVAPIIHESIVSCCKIRLEEQLPVAMEIEEQMVPIREKHQDAITALLNYPQLTATQYFTEALRIMEIPEYPDEEEE
jgi:hypothetical protein